MFPRHRIDIAFDDLAYALVASLLAVRRGALATAIERGVAPPDDAIACLSVRSGFDLLLGALALPAGSEVLVSAITHPDMVGILELRGLRPIPVDLDLDTLEPRADLLEAGVTERTRMVLVAHLFGGAADLAPVAEIARRHDLLLVEDCAQSLNDAFVRMDPLADVSLFSFGPIKTATALGGGILRVRDPELCKRMRCALHAWPVQPRHEFLVRSVKFSAIAFLARPAVFALFARACALSGGDLDRVLSSFVRGFKIAYDAPAFCARIRRRPSAPLLALLGRRLRRLDAARLARRAHIGDQLARSLPQSAFRPGWRARGGSTHWVFPVVVPDPSALALAARWLLERVVFLPCYPDLSDGAVQRLVEAVRDALGPAGARPTPPRRELAATVAR